MAAEGGTDGARNQKRSADTLYEQRRPEPPEPEKEPIPGAPSQATEEEARRGHELPPNRLLVLASRPRQCVEARQEEGFAVEKDDRTGLVTLIHPKRFTRTESWFQKRLKGPEVLRRPLDRYGTRLWELCDGELTVAQVVEVMEAEFHEVIHPAAARVQKLLERLVMMGFVELLPPAAEVLEQLKRIEGR